MNIEPKSMKMRKSWSQALWVIPSGKNDGLGKLVTQEEVENCNFTGLFPSLCACLCE